MQKVITKAHRKRHIEAIAARLKEIDADLAEIQAYFESNRLFVDAANVNRLRSMAAEMGKQVARIGA